MYFLSFLKQILFYLRLVENQKFQTFKVRDKYKNVFFGGVNAVSKSEAVGDDRRGGYGVIF